MMFFMMLLDWLRVVLYFFFLLWFFHLDLSSMVWFWHGNFLHGVFSSIIGIFCFFAFWFVYKFLTILDFFFEGAVSAELTVLIQLGAIIAIVPRLFRQIVAGGGLACSPMADDRRCHCMRWWFSFLLLRLGDHLAWLPGSFHLGLIIYAFNSVVLCLCFLCYRLVFRLRFSLLGLSDLILLRFFFFLDALFMWISFFYLFIFFFATTFLWCLWFFFFSFFYMVVIRSFVRFLCLFFFIVAAFLGDSTLWLLLRFSCEVLLFQLFWDVSVSGSRISLLTTIFCCDGGGVLSMFFFWRVFPPLILILVALCFATIFF